MNDIENKICVLGTEYSIEVHKISNDEHMIKNSMMGYCWYDEKLIVIPDTSEKEYFDFADNNAEISFINKVLRHEIIHAFLYESGLPVCCEWANNEMIVDWIAIQSPKIENLINSYQNHMWR